MRIQFCGADRTVTGTCHLVEVNGLRIFLDFGLYQGPRQMARQMNEWLPDDVRTADAVILSHGHLDHCGKLPVIARSGFTGPIYCTSATAAVARIVLSDAAQIQLEDVDYLNRRTVEPGRPPIKPLYTPEDIPGTVRLFKTVAYNQKVDLGKGVSFTLYDAGHILGSAYIVMEWNEGAGTKRLLFTADVGRYNTPIIRDPQAIPGVVDHFITESTYGNRSHGPIEQVGIDLLDAVKTCIQRRSRLLVPAFAVGRTQTILWYMQKFIHEGAIPEIPIFVDSPMGVEVSRVHSQFPDYYDDQTKAMLGKNDLFGLARVTFASTSEQSKQINFQRGPCVVIASSPTCEFGRILHHLKQSIERPDDMVVFVGFTPPYTLGRRIQEGQKRVRIYDRLYEVRCQVRTIHGLSAHADGEELLKFLKPTLTASTHAHVVHGEPDSAEDFAQKLLAAGVGSAFVPARESAVLDG